MRRRRRCGSVQPGESGERSGSRSLATRRSAWSRRAVGSTRRRCRRRRDRWVQHAVCSANTRRGRRRTSWARTRQGCTRSCRRTRWPVRRDVQPRRRGPAYTRRVPPDSTIRAGWVRGTSSGSGDTATDRTTVVSVVATRAVQHTTQTQPVMECIT